MYRSEMNEMNESKCERNRKLAQERKNYPNSIASHRQFRWGVDALKSHVRWEKFDSSFGRAGELELSIIVVIIGRGGKNRKNRPQNKSKRKKLSPQRKSEWDDYPKKEKLCIFHLLLNGYFDLYQSAIKKYVRWITANWIGRNESFIFGMEREKKRKKVCFQVINSRQLRLHSYSTAINIPICVNRIITTQQRSAEKKVS